MVFITSQKLLNENPGGARVKVCPIAS